MLYLYFSLIIKIIVARVKDYRYIYMGTFDFDKSFFVSNILNNIFTNYSLLIMLNGFINEK